MSNTTTDLQTDSTLPALDRVGHQRCNRIDLDRAIKLRLKGATLQEIADIFGVTKQSVSQRLADILPADAINIETYKSHRADILAADQLRFRRHLTDEKLAKAPAQTLGWLFGVFYDKERLERGQSTENVSIKNVATHLVTVITDIEKRISELS